MGRYTVALSKTTRIFIGALLQLILHVDSASCIRLPDTVIPQHYNLTFHPHIYGANKDSFHSQGTADIQLHCLKKTNTIFIHSLHLNWTDVTLTDTESRSLDIELYNHTDEEWVEVKVDEDLIVNHTYHLYIEFHNPITDNLKGFYYSPYKENNVTKYIFTTMMEPTDARRVFPCFDEPDFKAIFQINILRQTVFKSLSNAQLKETIQINETLVMDMYADSPKMSTYLVAFAIGDIDAMETQARGIELRTWSRSSAVALTKFSLDVGSKLMTFFEDYFQIPYSLPKCDSIAVPTMIFNAMEHWGMITYRETSMFFEKSVSSEADREWIAIIVAHELSHQWFGNIVSPKWWDDLWLNEGFATYMMFLAVDHVFPDWKMMNQLTVDYRGVQSLMGIDDVLASHPVYIPVHHPKEINEIFDLISYAKGCSVIRMMNFFLGESTFTNGLTRYLKKYSFSTATHNDLWQVLGEQSSDDGNGVTDVKLIMDTWLLEKNYPVVTLTRTSPTSFTLSQMAFLLDEVERRNRSHIFWEIPFAYTHDLEIDFNKKPTDIIWLHKDGADVHVEDSSLGESSWIIGNVQQHGFFRVNYELDNWNAILRQLKTNHLLIHPINRAQIINDAFNLARADLLDFSIALHTLEYLDLEVDIVPWKAALKVLNGLQRSLQLTPAFGDFMMFMQKKLANAYNQNIKADTHHGKVQNSVMASQSCYYGMQKCETAALQEFQYWISNVSYNVNPDLKKAIYCTGVKIGGAAAWDKVLQRYQKCSSASERLFLLRALACVKEPWVIKKFLHLTVFTDIFSTNDEIDAIGYISRNPIGRLMAWDYVVEHWDHYFKRHGAGLNLFAHLVKSLTMAYNTPSELHKVESFIREHTDLGTATREFQNAVTKIKFNIGWMEKHYENLQRWLKGQTSQAL